MSHCSKTARDLERSKPGQNLKTKRPINRIINTNTNKGRRAIFPNAAHPKGGFNTYVAAKLKRNVGPHTVPQIYSSNSEKLHFLSSLRHLPSERFLLSVSGFLSGSKLSGEQLPMSKSVHVKKVLCLKSSFKVSSCCCQGGTHSRHPGVNQPLFFFFVSSASRSEGMLQSLNVRCQHISCRRSFFFFLFLTAVNVLGTC